MINYTENYGFINTFKLLKNKLLFNFLNTSFKKEDVLKKYEFISNKNFSSINKAVEPPEKSINWVIPPFGKGSGGHLNIFRFIKNLENIGFSCRIIIVCEPQPVSAKQAKKEITDWFFPLAAEVFLENDDIPPAYYTIATEWRTAYWVRNFPLTLHRCYFVQDFEPWFYPVGSEYIFSEETYNFNFTAITAGDWLKEKLISEYRMNAYAVGFSYDKDIYYYDPKYKKIDTKKVFFYARPPTQRRAFELGLLVLSEVSQRIPEVEIVFAGWDISSYSIPFKHVNAGLLLVDELPKLYNECDVALVLSLTNLSLLPLELMACGTPVVSNSAPWTTWLLNNDNSLLALPTVLDLASAVCLVLTDKNEASRIQKGGFSTVALTDWSAEAEKMAHILLGLDS